MPAGRAIGQIQMRIQLIQVVVGTYNAPPDGHPTVTINGQQTEEKHIIAVRTWWCKSNHSEKWCIMKPSTRKHNLPIPFMASSFCSVSKTVCLMLCNVLIKLAMPEVSIAFSNVCLHTAQLQPRRSSLCTARTAGFFLLDGGWQDMGSSSNNHRSVENGCKKKETLLASEIFHWLILVWKERRNLQFHWLECPTWIYTYRSIYYLLVTLGVSIPCLRAIHVNGILVKKHIRIYIIYTNITTTYSKHPTQ